MPRLFALLSLLVTLAPVLAAQPASDSALVAQIYDDLAEGDIPAVTAVLDDHVTWTEGAHGPQRSRHFGPGTVAADVLQPQAATHVYEPNLIAAEGGRVVAEGTTCRVDPATGQRIAVRFRHAWQVFDGRVVSVHLSDDGPDLSASNLCGPGPC